MRNKTIFFLTLISSSFFAYTCSHTATVNEIEKAAEEAFIIKNLIPSREGDTFFCGYEINGIKCREQPHSRLKMIKHIKAHGYFNSILCSCGGRFKGEHGHATHVRHIKNELVSKRTIDDSYPTKDKRVKVQIGNSNKNQEVPKTTTKILLDLDSVEEEKLPDDLERINLFPLDLDQIPYQRLLEELKKENRIFP